MRQKLRGVPKTVKELWFLQSEPEPNNKAILVSYSILKYLIVSYGIL